MVICTSPQLFAAYHVFLRLLKPRHPPSALIYFLLYLCNIFFLTVFTLYIITILFVFIITSTVGLFIVNCQSLIDNQQRPLYNIALFYFSIMSKIFLPL